MPGIRFVSVRSLGMGLSLAWLACSAGCMATGGWMMNNSGMGYYQNGNYAMARHEFAQAVAINPYDPDYRHNLAMTMRKMGDAPSAERVLRHNLTIDAMHQPTYHALAQTMMEQGRQGEAQELLVTWADTQPYLAASHVELAWLEREMGNLPGAEQQLRHALQIEPRNPVALANLGEVYQQTGQSQQAVALYQRSLATNWNQPAVQSRLASLNQPIAGPGSVQLASRSSMLPPPVFAQNGPQQFAGMHGPQPIPMMAGTMPGPMVMGSQPVITSYPPTSMPAPTTVVSTEPITIPGTITMPASVAGPTLEMPVPDPAMSGWQPVKPAAGRPTLPPSADPAHGSEMTANLPVVDPY